MAKSWGNTKAPSNSDRTSIDDIVDIYKFNSDFTPVRFMGPITSIATHWFDIMTKDKSKVPIGKVCLNYNPATEEYEDNSCPYCEASLKVSTRYFTNAIIRDFQESEPRRKYPPNVSEQKVVNLGDKNDPFKARIKDKKSKTWTPVRIISLPATLTSQLIDLSQTNRHLVSTRDGKVEQTFHVAHPRYGCDVEINLKTGGSYGFGKYDVQKGPVTPITKTERGYLLWTLDLSQPESLKDAVDNMKRLESKIVERTEGSEKSTEGEGGRERKRRAGVDDDPYDKDDDSDYIETRSRRTKKRRKPKEDDEFAELDRSLTRKRKKSSSTRTRSRERNEEETPSRTRRRRR